MATYISHDGLLVCIWCPTPLKSIIVQAKPVRGMQLDAVTRHQCLKNKNDFFLLLCMSVSFFSGVWLLILQSLAVRRMWHSLLMFNISHGNCFHPPEEIQELHVPLAEQVHGSIGETQHPGKCRGTLYTVVWLRCPTLCVRAYQQQCW